MAGTFAAVLETVIACPLVKEAVAVTAAVAVKRKVSLAVKSPSLTVTVMVAVPT